MRKIVALSGMPGVGKSTLTREFMKQFDDLEWIEIKHIPHYYSKKANLIILGKYTEGETFPGTDRYGLNVQPHAKELLKEKSEANIFFEGDRIGNQSFFEFCSELPNTELHIGILTADERTLQSRYLKRGSQQSKTFLQGRQTKIDGIQRNFYLMEYITVFPHENREDTNKIIEWMNGIFENV